MGPQPPSGARRPERARELATKAGLNVVDLRSEKLPMTFHDVGAVVYFLRLVVWIVPDFSVDRYRERLRALHDATPFHATSTRFLIEATKPS